MTLAELRYVTDLAAAAWIRERLHPFAQDVGSVIPEGFEDYARIFHPAYREHDRPVTWRDIARANGRVVHPAMQFGNIAGTWSRSSPDPDLWTRSPHQGTLPLDAARALVSVLRPCTKTPEACWFAVWVGWGNGRDGAGLPQLVIPHREYFLASGSVDDAARSVHAPMWPYQSASMWWPDDRAWFVSTEVDFTYTYVGGTRECIDAVVAHPEIEALRAGLSEGITYDSDRINPSSDSPF